MHLTQDDIDRIELQFSHPFYIEDKDGWYHLKNHNGRCIFHDGKKCTIYPIRPIGCKLYPHVYNIDNQEIIYDVICPNSEYFPSSTEVTKLLQLLITTLFKEKKIRQNKRK
jgi:Fe-S-cluster containining protein